MKKLIIISLCISVLCACGTMRGLQQQSSDKIHKTIKKNDEIYRLEKEGHSPDVKMKILDKQHSRIYIPVEYIGKIEKMESIKQIKAISKQEKEHLLDNAECYNCMLGNNYLNIDINYNNGGFGKCSGILLTSPIWLPLDILTLISSGESVFLNSIGDSCIKKQENNYQKSYVYQPFIENLEKLKKMGIIDFTFDVSPKQLQVSCNKKSCAVLDENNNFVDKVIINKSISINQKRVNELLSEEAAAEKRRKEEEAKEERKRQREEKRKQQLRKDECPFLYGIITYRGIDANRLLQIDATKRYVELNCDIWLNDYIRSH